MMSDAQNCSLSLGPLIATLFCLLRAPVIGAEHKDTDVNAPQHNYIVSVSTL